MSTTGTSHCCTSLPATPPRIARIAPPRPYVAITTSASLGLLVTVGLPERIVGHALYAPAGDGRAEVAFAIAAEYRSRRLATILLGQLADTAAASGMETFEAVVLPENRRMLQVLRESGFPIKTYYDWATWR